MKIIKDWTTIQCPWCHKNIDFEGYHYFEIPELAIIKLTSNKILLFEINLSIELSETLYNNFLVVWSKLLNQELQVFVPRPEARLHKDGYCYIFIHSPDCMDYFTLNIMNILNDKMVYDKDYR